MNCYKDCKDHQKTVGTCPVAVSKGTVVPPKTATVTAQKVFARITQAAGSC